MYLNYDPDWYETVVDYKPCPCKGKCMGSCSGSFSVGSRQRSIEEVMKIKKERRIKEEDAILKQAEEIKVRRGLL